MASERRTCEGKVAQIGYLPYRICGATAKHEEGGKWYCGRCAPSKQEERRVKSNAKWNARVEQERAALQRNRAIAAAKERVVAASFAMRRLEYALPTPQADRDAYDAAYDEWCAAVDALLALTEGSDGV